MTAFVLVPGMCHGGWCFADLTAQLRGLGHVVHPVTPTGIGERSHLLSGGVNLDTHIEDVTALLAAEDVHDAVLVGHSYGGMVITGAADRLPGRVDSLVYLDVVDSGYAVRPLPFFDPRATPHPLASVLQPLRLTGDPARVRRRDYVYAAGWDGESPFTPVYERLRADPTWTTHSLDGGHNLMRDAPGELLKILLDVATK
ncbi:alpha/beta fold hydrolase [Amycolatopsis sp. cmx-4-83]|uniref:alpha/beta fold hydrolase n=1 Tax=Amycolatopsis sp. cmx-4-83 TaxID=2790940 RepID=UPI00397BA51E